MRIASVGSCYLSFFMERNVWDYKMVANLVVRRNMSINAIFKIMILRATNIQIHRIPADKEYDIIWGEILPYLVSTATNVNKRCPCLNECRNDVRQQVTELARQQGWEDKC